jgi:hypothetical protein
MKISNRRAATTFGILMVFLTVSLSSLAQDPAAKKPAEKADAAPVARKKYDPARRVPDYFGQIGITIEQREAIYRLRKTHHEKIDVLKKQIADQEAASMKECEALLTDTQKKLLENLRSEGGRGPSRVTDAARK